MNTMVEKMMKNINLMHGYGNPLMVLPANTFLNVLNEFSEIKDDNMKIFSLDVFSKENYNEVLNSSEKSIVIFCEGALDFYSKMNLIDLLRNKGMMSKTISIVLNESYVTDFNESFKDRFIIKNL